MSGFKLIGIRANSGCYINTIAPELYLTATLLTLI